MKTAKELCEEKQNELVNKIIGYIKRSPNLEWVCTELFLDIDYRFYKSYKYDEFFELIKSNKNNVQDKLTALGYTIKFDTMPYNTHLKSVYKEVTTPGFKLFGIQLVKPKMKKVFVNDEWEQRTMKVIKISACCGE